MAMQLQALNTDGMETCIIYRMEISVALANKVAYKNCALWHQSVLFWCYRAHFCVQGTLQFLKHSYSSCKNFLCTESTGYFLIQITKKAEI